MYPFNSKGGMKMSELRIMDEKAGDLKVIWDKDNQEEVDAAEAQFDALVKKHYIAYTVNKDGKAGKKITKFDPDAEKIILAPMVQGG
jgi:hypothetical protein